MDEGTSSSWSSPGSGPCIMLYQNWCLTCSQPCRSFYETLVHHGAFAHTCSLPGGSSGAAAGFWGSGAGCLMLSSTAVVRRQLPGLVPGEQESCLAPQHPAHVPCSCTAAAGTGGHEGVPVPREDGLGERSLLRSPSAWGWPWERGSGWEPLPSCRLGCSPESPNPAQQVQGMKQFA